MGSHSRNMSTPRYTLLVLVGLLVAAGTIWLLTVNRSVPSERHIVAANVTTTGQASDVSPPSAVSAVSPLAAPSAATNQVTDRKTRLLKLSELFAVLEREGRLAQYARSLEESLQGTRADRDALEELVLLFQSPMLKDGGKEYLYLKRFVEYDKTNPSALLRLSQYEAQHQDTQAAFDLASEAAKVHPERASAHRLDGAIFLRNAGDLERSAQICQQIIRDPAAEARGLLYAGDQLTQLGRTDLAIQAYSLAAERADQENLRQRAQVSAYSIRARAEGVEAVRAELETLAAGGVTPLVQRQAASVLTNYPARSP